MHRMGGIPEGPAGATPAVSGGLSVRHCPADGSRRARRPGGGIPRRLAIVMSVALMGTAPALAGELVVYNLSHRPITCFVDGYTKATGADMDLRFRAEPGQRLNIPPSFRLKERSLNFIDCGGLRMRAMKITPESSDRVVFLNGRQRRVLNALLYASIPTDPNAGFTPLVRWLIESYQAAHPDVLLNLVLDPAIDVYSFGNLKDAVFSAQGFDVAEIDTVFLQWLKDGGLINPAAITGDKPWPVALEAVTIDGKTYGVPSWLCSEFLITTGGDVQSIRTFGDLQAYMAKTPAGRRALVGDLNGTWTIPAAYIQAFAQSHGGATASDAAAAPIEADVVARMAKFGGFCALSNTNPCIDGTFHSAKDGAVERDLATEPAANAVGFSERTFFAALYQERPAALTLVPVPWGDEAGAPKLAYSDAFITSRTACGKEPCASDAAGLGAFLTSAATKKYIALSKDLPAGDPARHLIVATEPFYDDDDVKGDAVYARILGSFLKGEIQPYLNSFTPKLQYDLLSGICPILREQSPDWKCKAPKKPDGGPGGGRRGESRRGGAELAGRGWGEVVPDDFAALHHEADALKLGDVGQRVGGDGDEVGVLAGGEGADTVLPSQGLGVHCRRGLESARRSHAGALDEGFEVEGLGSVGVGGAIDAAAHHDFQTRGGCGHGYGFFEYRNDAKPAAGVPGVDVIDGGFEVANEGGVVIEPLADHQGGLGRIEVEGVLDGVAAGDDGVSFAVAAVNVTGRFFAEAVSLVDQRLQDGHGISGRVLNVAGGGEGVGAGGIELDPVGAMIDLVADGGAGFGNRADHGAG